MSTPEDPVSFRLGKLEGELNGVRDAVGDLRQALAVSQQTVHADLKAINSALSKLAGSQSEDVGGQVARRNQITTFIATISLLAAIGFGLWQIIGHAGCS